MDMFKRESEPKWKPLTRTSSHTRHLCSFFSFLCCPCIDSLITLRILGEKVQLGHWKFDTVGQSISGVGVGGLYFEIE